MITKTQHCRLSGELLDSANILMEIENCPFPGIYPQTAAESLPLQTPLRVVQATHSGFVQLAHSYDASLYRQYSFAGAGSIAYQAHIGALVREIENAFPKNAAVLEIGCGDGLLVKKLYNAGFREVMGIDPGRAMNETEMPRMISGYFPADLPAACQKKKYDLIISRHVLEHIETPIEFVKSMASHLSQKGQIWIEVPDLDSTVRKELWTNFYQLHCNYFTSVTLDQMMAKAEVYCKEGRIADIFGGSLLRKYEKNVLCSAYCDVPSLSMDGGVRIYREKLEHLASQLPSGAMGYGAAERTATTFGLCPSLAKALGGLYDGNPLLSERYLAGTDLRIRHKEGLFSRPPSALVLFAISNVAEIISEWKQRLPGNILVALAAGNMALKPLKDYL